MDYKQIEYFLTLARQGSVSGAAEFLNISQPALSKSIRNLEKEVGVQLFDRLGNRVRINKNGQDLYAYARRSVQDIRAGLETVRQNRYDLTGELLILSYTMLDSIMDCVLQYRRLNPKVRLSLQQSGLGENEDHASVDLILRAAPAEEDPAEGAWIGTKLFTEPFYAMISSRDTKLDPEWEEIDLAMLKDREFVSIRPNYPYFTDSTIQFCEEAGFTPHIAYQTNDFLTKCHLMGEGLAVGFLPECCVEKAQRLYPELRAFPVKNPQKRERSIWLLRRAESQNTETALDFWEFAKDWFEEKTQHGI